MLRIAFMRFIETSTSPSGICPPTSPVLPPCGVIDAPAAPQSFTMSAASAVFAGKTRQGVRPL